ncbi:hypothetical protein MMC28_002026 [Mycoblastus sanguinarius]|nr:hypothetical protein [Mycoblastus sanguinarius]
MSSDLLKEFGLAEGNPWGRPPKHDAAYEAGEDDFGDFEGPGSAGDSGGTHIATIGPTELLNTSQENASLDYSILSPAIGTLADPFSADEFNYSLDSAMGGKPAISHVTESKRKKPFSTPTFTQGLPSRVTVPSKPTINYPSIDDEWGDFVEKSVLFDADDLISSKSSESTSQRIQRDDPGEPLPRYIFSQDSITPTEATLPNLPIENAKPKKAKDLGPPPSNIPPPSVLLSVTTTLLQFLSTRVKSIINHDRASSDPYEELDQPRIEQVQEALATARACARIIAGRKLRWKRDTLLSQGMKIGPASKAGGMKLTGIDKTETRREEQEVTEAVRAWRQQAGPLRNTIALVNVHSENDLKVPDISENMPIRLGQSSEGTVSAPKCCFLCGIKRDERIARVDVDVEDSFGEYWTDYWGHVDCVKFWRSHNGSLHQR